MTDNTAEQSLSNILDYRNHKKPKAAWENMERLHLMRKQGLIPNLEYEAVCAEVTYQLLDTAPSEYCAPESDSA